MAEWLRRLTRNQMGSSRVGSNPTRSGHFSVYVQIVKFSYILKSVQILHAEVILSAFYDVFDHNIINQNCLSLSLYTYIKEIGTLKDRLLLTNFRYPIMNECEITLSLQ